MKMTFDLYTRQKVEVDNDEFDPKRVKFEDLIYLSPDIKDNNIFDTEVASITVELDNGDVIIYEEDYTFYPEQ